mmetsp:Transcript_20254/g.46906  ORF Transcript_20254/g.46906 Transcript_20254/m.46906 type:complete len:83 (-) Transcript_20254:851-1099(-)
MICNSNNEEFRYFLALNVRNKIENNLEWNQLARCPAVTREGTDARPHHGNRTQMPRKFASANVGDEKPNFIQPEKNNFQTPF